MLLHYLKINLHNILCVDMLLDNNHGLKYYIIVIVKKGGIEIEKLTGATGVIINFGHKLVVLKLSIVIMPIVIIKKKYSGSTQTKSWR